MQNNRSLFIDELAWRGLLQDQTPGAVAAFVQPGARAYMGFDPTADSLHVGNLASLMLLVHLQRSGHRPLLLVGGATGMIGDPSGKRSERKLLGAEEIQHNVACIRLQLQHFLDFDGTQAAHIVDNREWFEHFRFLDFLRDVGKHMTLNYMLAKDSVQSRLETGISYTEFSYQLLQAYDFYYLHKHHGVRVQMGGSDQWGNITSGIELIRRIDGAEAHGLICPLLTRADGSKFGKSEQGNIWLDARLTSPYKFYQFWLNAADDEVGKLLKVFSLRPRAEIEQLIGEQAQNPGARIGQRALALEMTRRIHGDAALEKAIQASEVLFGQASLETMQALSERDFHEIFEGVPTTQLPLSKLQEPIAIADLLADAGAVPSKSEARRLLKGGGIRVNKQAVTETQTLGLNDLLGNRYLLLQTGKKKYHLAVFQG
ncbi:MAG: tyrosine--tRNA ligase [Bacteroidetes bacterium]|jgi:tyrosyl-tRNA synthetase|nr:tyrosine--tRNA ligase [Bacteroidota bacterium]